jgi:hypothetical protein
MLFDENYSICLRKSLVRRPVDGEWARFESYARRIKALFCCTDRYYDPRGEDVIEESMFEALAAHFQEPPVLPNLHSLSCTEGAGINKYIGLFLTPRLTHLRFSPSTDNSPDPAVVESIKIASPNLRNLQICPGPFYGQCPPSLLTSASTLVGSLSALESFHCGFPLSPAAIVRLSRLSSLAKLVLFDHPRAIASSLAGTSGPAFAHLTTLVFTARDGPSTIKLLTTLCLKNLKNLEIHFARLPGM